MAGGDMVARFGFDTSEFTRGSRLLVHESKEAGKGIIGAFEETGRGAAKHILKTFGVFKLAKKEFHFAQEAVHEYGGAFDFASAEVEHLREVTEGLKLDVGRDLFGPVTHGAVEFMHTVRELRNEIVDFAADFLDNPLSMGLNSTQAEDVNAATKEAEALDKKLRNQKAFAKSFSELKEENFKLAGFDAMADTEAENRRHQEAIEKIKEQGKTYHWTDEQARKFQVGEDSRHQRRLAQIEKEDEERRLKALNEQTREIDQRNREKSEEDKARKDALAKSSDARFGLNADAADKGIESLRMRGLEKQADLLKLRLDLAKQLRDINKDDALTEQEKVFYKQQAVDAEKELEAATESKYQVEAEKEAKRGGGGKDGPELAAGFYSAGLSRAVFGGPGSLSTKEDKALKAQQDANVKLEENKKLLADISRGIADLNAAFAE